MLRALFISLSENRSLRGMAERSAIGRRLSSRFVAGTQVDDALRVTQTVNQKGLSVSVDNLGENVTNAEEAQTGLGDKLSWRLQDRLIALGVQFTELLPRVPGAEPRCATPATASPSTRITVHPVGSSASVWLSSMVTVPTPRGSRQPCPRRPLSWCT